MGFLHSYCIFPLNIFKTVFYEGTNYLKKMSPECKGGGGGGGQGPEKLRIKPVG